MSIISGKGWTHPQEFWDGLIISAKPPQIDAVCTTWIFD
jgi:hypothetical protein